MSSEEWGDAQKTTLRPGVLSGSRHLPNSMKTVQPPKPEISFLHFYRFRFACYLPSPSSQPRSISIIPCVSAGKHLGTWVLSC